MIGKQILEQLKPYEQGKQTSEIKEQYNLSEVIKLSSNENPYGYSPKVKTYFKNYIPEFNIYPDGYATQLRETIATKLQLKNTQIVFGSGSDEMIQSICRAFLSPDANTVMAKPTFSQYKQSALIEGAEIKEVPTKDGYHDLDLMLKAIDTETKIVWICSPDNPTGTLVSKEKLINFMKQCPKDVLVILDEAYYEFISKDKAYNTVTLLKQFNNLILLRTFSKAYGLAGLRIGYGLMDEAVATKLNIVRGPFNTTTISQDAARVAFEDEGFINEVAQNNQTVKESFQNFLSELGWSYFDTETNFILLKTPISGTDVFDYLIQHGFIVRPGELLGYPNTIRITIGTADEMKQLEKLIQKLHAHINKEV